MVTEMSIHTYACLTLDWKKKEGCTLDWKALYSRIWFQNENN